MNTMTGAVSAMADSANDKALREEPPVWTEALVDRLCALLDQRLNYPAAARALGLTKKAVSAKIFRLRQACDPRLPVIIREPKPLVNPRSSLARPMPTDFAEHARTKNNKELQRHYHCGASSLARWLAAYDGPRTPINRATAPPIPRPANFDVIAAQMTIVGACAHFQRGRDVIIRWFGESGIAPRRPSANPFRHTGQRIDRAHHDQRDMSRVGQAVQFLQRYGAVFRCNANGVANPKRGSHWNRNGHILTDADIIQRAERLGWSPDDWKKIAA